MSDRKKPDHTSSFADEVPGPPDDFIEAEQIDRRGRRELPSPRLRWVRRGSSRVLQQWWDIDTFNMEPRPLNAAGEWRDVPTED